MVIDGWMDADINIQHSLSTPLILFRVAGGKTQTHLTSSTYCCVYFVKIVMSVWALHFLWSVIMGFNHVICPVTVVWLRPSRCCRIISECFLMKKHFTVTVSSHTTLQEQACSLSSVPALSVSSACCCQRGLRWVLLLLHPGNPDPDTEQASPATALNAAGGLSV